MPWSDYRDDIESHFNPRRAVPDFESYFARYRAASAAARASLAAERDIRYGDGPLATLDHHPAGTGKGPLVVHIHGGYWRGLDKSLVEFAAAPLVALGLPFASLNYDLCPKVTLERLVAQVMGAIAFLARDAQRFGHDGRIYLTGDSAGAHLCAMALAEDWSRHGLGGDFICGGALYTGIYEIEPVLHISVNAEIRLTPDLVAPLSPMRHPPRRPVPLLLAVGAAEPAGWIEQTLDYAEICRRAGCEVEVIRAPGENHFSMTLSRADAGHALTRALAQAVARH
ncbi:MAG: alpha/beta hydrolase [Alphaproteobacteria bacterium]|nr:alpha/beta hydrolase [Alphaproteobacteria bacterium]